MQIIYNKKTLQEIPITQADHLRDSGKLIFKDMQAVKSYATEHKLYKCIQNNCNNLQYTKEDLCSDCIPF